MIYLLLFLSLNFSCTDKKVSNTKSIPSASSKELFEALNVEDSTSLKYTSGIRSILQDRQGHYWIGSHQEGACFFDGKSFHYFTKEDGLSGNQVRTIQEGKDGTIWFGDRDPGAWKYDGTSMTNYSIDPALRTQHIWEFYEDQNGVLLIAMNDGGVYKFTENSFERMF